MVRIAQITDLHLDDFLADYYNVDARNNLVQVLSHVKQNNITGIVITGDLGETTSRVWLLAQLAETGLPFEFIFGNHDEIEQYTDLDILKLKLKPSGLFFTASLGEKDWVFLDSRTGEIDQAQLKWLETVIQEWKAEEDLIVFVHHPILDCGNTAMDRKNALKNRDQVRKILEEFKGAVRIFCGHYHNNDERQRKNITQYLTGSCLAQIRFEAEDVELENKKIFYRVIEFDETGINSWPVLVDKR